MSPTVRVAGPTDVDVISTIYGDAVRHSVATFDESDPPRSYWEKRICSPVPGDHVLVVEGGGGVVGYAYSGAFRPRAAYSLTRETSVYLSPDAVGAGLGRLIYTRLLSLLRDDRMHLAVAVIALPNLASTALHESLGFEVVGTFNEVGRKFDQWVDTRWYQLRL